MTEFIVQLYGWVDGEWHLVAQFDHNPTLPNGHDVRSEGIHMDLFRDGEKVDVEFTNHPGPVKPAFALNYAINYLSEHAQPLIERYQRCRTE